MNQGSRWRTTKAWREASWPRLESRFTGGLARDRYSLYRSVDMEELRLWYVEGVEPKRADEIDPLMQWLCRPDAPLAWFGELNELHDTDNFGYHALSFLESPSVYLSQNTFFAGRDGAVHGALRGAEERFGMEGFRDFHQFVSHGLPDVRSWFGRSAPNQYVQAGRHLDRLGEAIATERIPKTIQFDPEAYPDRTIVVERLMPLAVALRWREAFDALVVDTAERVGRLCTETARGTVLDRAWRYANGVSRIKAHAEHHWAGAELSLAIRYPSSDHLEAIWPLLVPATRWPRREGGPSDSLVWTLTQVEEPGPNRATRALIRSLWESNFDPVEQVRLDERTLFVRLRMPAHTNLTLEAVHHLCGDMRDFERRYLLKRRRRYDDDNMQSRSNYPGRGVAVIRPLHGKVQAGGLGYDPIKVYFSGGDAALDRILRARCTEVERMDALLGERGRLVRSSRAWKAAL